MKLTNGIFTCEIPDDDVQTRAERERVGWQVIGDKPEEQPEAEEQEKPEAEAEAEEQPEEQPEAPKPKRGRKATNKAE